MEFRCDHCQSTKPGQRGFKQVDQGTFHRFKHDCRFHPLRTLFLTCGFGLCEGMNWLQDRGLIADECLTLYDVAPVDVLRVLDAAAGSDRLNRIFVKILRDEYLIDLIPEEI